MKTDKFHKGDRVRINIVGHFLRGMEATVVGRDAHTVQVRFDTVTEEMKGYEDTRTGVAEFEPNQLEKI